MTNTILKIIGEYRLKDNKLYSQDTGLIIHIRERSKATRGNKPQHFIDVHKPTYEYISSLYPKSIAIGSSENKVIATVRKFDFDYKRTKYTLTLNNEQATIEQVGGAK